MYLHLSNHVAPDIAATSFFIWVPSFLASWIATWSLSASYFTKFDSSSTSSIFLSGLFFNLVAIGVPVINLITALPLGLVLQHQSTIAINAYIELVALLDSKAAEWNPATFIITDLLPLLPEGNKVKMLGHTFYSTVKLVSGIWSAWAFVLLIFGVTFSTLQLRSLSKAIKAASSTVTNAKHPTANVLQAQAVKSTFFTLILVVSTFSLMTLIFTGCALFIAIQPFVALGQVQGIQTTALISLYSFTIPGLVTTGLVLRLSLQNLRTNKKVTTLVILPAKSYTTFAAPNAFRREEIRSKYMGSLDYSYEGRGDASMDRKGLDLQLECFSPGAVHVMRKNSVTIEEGWEEDRK